MPSTYIKQNNVCVGLPKNMGLYKTKGMGIRFYKTNRNYVSKKPHSGVLAGTSLSLEDCTHIQNLFRKGWKKVYLMKKYNLSRYYLNRVLNLQLSPN